MRIELSWKWSWDSSLVGTMERLERRTLSGNGSDILGKQ